MTLMAETICEAVKPRSHKLTRGFSILIIGVGDENEDADDDHDHDHDEEDDHYEDEKT